MFQQDGDAVKSVDELLETLADANAKWKALEKVFGEIKKEINEQRKAHENDPDVDC